MQPWDVWYADLNPTEGREQAGRRPVIIVSSAFHLRVASSLVTVVPLTTRHRPFPFRVRIDSLKETSYAITEQVRTISRSRLSGGSRYGRLTMDEIAMVRNVLDAMVAWTTPPLHKPVE